MSEVLLEFLEPYSEHWVSQGQFEKLVIVGVIAWNAALLPGSKREDFLREMMQTVPPDVRSDMRVILAEMILRKELLFASNKRMIVSFDVTMTPAGPHLSVVSTFDK